MLSSNHMHRNIWYPPFFSLTNYQLHKKVATQCCFCMKLVSMIWLVLEDIWNKILYRSLMFSCFWYQMFHLIAAKLAPSWSFPFTIKIYESESFHVLQWIHAFKIFRTWYSYGFWGQSLAAPHNSNLRKQLKHIFYQVSCSLFSLDHILEKAIYWYFA